MKSDRPLKTTWWRRHHSLNWGKVCPCEHCQTLKRWIWATLTPSHWYWVFCIYLDHITALCSSTITQMCTETTTGGRGWRGGHHRALGLGWTPHKPHLLLTDCQHGAPDINTFHLNMSIYGQQDKSALLSNGDFPFSLLLYKSSTWSIAKGNFSVKCGACSHQIFLMFGTSQLAQLW